MVKDKLKTDSVQALKNHDSKRVEVLRFLISLIDKRELQLPPGTMVESEEINVLRKELKNKEESKEMFLKAGRQDLVNDLDFEIDVVKQYLPQQMNQEELGSIVDQVIDEKGTNFGLVMREVMVRVEGRIGGDVVSQIVKQKISDRG